MSKGITIVGELVVTFNGLPLGTLNSFPVVTTDRTPSVPDFLLDDIGYRFPPEFIGIILGMGRGKGKKCEPKT